MRTQTSFSLVFLHKFFGLACVLWLFLFPFAAAYACSPGNIYPYAQILPPNQSENIPINTLIVIQYRRAFPWDSINLPLRESLRFIKPNSPLPNEVEVTIEKLAEGSIYRLRPTQPLQPNTLYAIRTKLNRRCRFSFSAIDCDLTEEYDLSTFTTGNTAQTVFPPFSGLQRAASHCNKYDNSCGRGCSVDYQAEVEFPPPSHPHRRFHLYNANDLSQPIGWYLSAPPSTPYPNSPIPPGQSRLQGDNLVIQKGRSYIVRAVELTGYEDSNTHAITATGSGCPCDWSEPPKETTTSSDGGNIRPESAPPENEAIPEPPSDGQEGGERNQEQTTTSIGCSFIVDAPSWWWLFGWIGIGWMRRRKRLAA